ncbi:response regulator transcription factor [Pseudomonas fluorescens]|uniref:response regulator transcription factor n=1 Tax=Pseudomonas fluorescens TaxID=294 RepID=UPI0017843D43|nr:response regulator transcription factor [Pseudomonas fluorescens]
MVEDDIALAGTLYDYLSEFELDIDHACDGRTCLELLKSNHYDVIILDVTMPRLNGIDTCRLIRHQGNTVPILFLTARDTLADKREGFGAGADDYLVKPFEPEELRHRINALLRRNRPHAPSTSLSCGDLELNEATCMATRGELRIQLPDIQFRIMKMLVEAAPGPLGRRQIELAIWPDSEIPESDPLRTHIYRLRRLLAKLQLGNSLVTLHGKGYRLAIPH